MSAKTPIRRLDVRLMAALLGGLLSAACLAEPPATPVPERIVADLATRADPNQHYSLYLPPNYDARRRWPVLILLDPRGRSEQTLEMARAGAAEHGWILISSRQSRSDDEEAITVEALQALLKETGEHYPYDPKRLYLAGMSGTSKTLWVVEKQLHGLVAGLIGAAGGRPPELGRLDKDAPAFYGITAYHDFNFQEMHELDDDLRRNGSPHRLAVFEGGHGWPSADGFSVAIDWLELMAMRSGLVERDEAWIDRQLAGARAEAEAIRDAADRWRHLDQLVRDFDGLRDVGAERRAASALFDEEGTRALLAQEKKLRGEEQRYLRTFNAWVTRYNTRVIDGRRQAPPDVERSLTELRVARLQAQALDADRRTADSATRLLQSLYAATASYLPRAQQGNGDLDRARTALAMAIRISPERPTAHCRLAQIEGLRHSMDAAFAELAVCLRLGGRDQENLRNDPEWQPLRGDARWPAMLERAASPP